MLSYRYDAHGRRIESKRETPSGTETEQHYYAPGWETFADIEAGTNHVKRLYISPGGMDSQVAMVVRGEGEDEWRTLWILR